MSETLKRLTQAFIGESQARNRYTFYAEIAEKEGFIQIGQIFLATADNEREHAEAFFDMIKDVRMKTSFKGEELPVDALAPYVIGITMDNLRAAIKGELYENGTMYPDIANVADKEGYRDIAARVRAIARVEGHHAERYQKLLKEVTAGTVFKKDKEVEWVCLNCGYVHKGKEPPLKCPSCEHPRGWYAVKCETY
jgi:rubrerythrin